MDEFENFFNYSLKFLSYRIRSEKEVRDALRRKKVSIETIEKIIEKLLELRFINDIEFAKLWVEQRTRIKPRSRYVIKMELQEKGIAQSIIDQSLASTEKNELQTAKELVKKYQRRFARYDKDQQKKKFFQLLQRRGFSWDIARETIDEALTKGV